MQKTTKRPRSPHRLRPPVHLSTEPAHSVDNQHHNPHMSTKHPITWIASATSSCPQNTPLAVDNLHPNLFIHEKPLWRSPYQMLLTGFATVFSSNIPPFHLRSVPEASNIGFATMFPDIWPVSKQRSGRGGAEVGFADRFPGILHISMQRSGCGGAEVGFADRLSDILHISKQRSGCGNAVVGFATRNRRLLQ